MNHSFSLHQNPLPCSGQVATPTDLSLLSPAEKRIPSFYKALTLTLPLPLSLGGGPNKTKQKNHQLALVQASQNTFAKASAAPQNFPCFLIKALLPGGRVGGACLFCVGSELSACRLLLPRVRARGGPAAPGRGTPHLCTTTRRAPRRGCRAWLSLAERTSNYFPWARFSLRGFSESLCWWAPLQPLFMREGRRRTPESVTFPGRAGGRNEGKAL